jgi:CRP-like cAMP-binding protein
MNDDLKFRNQQSRLSSAELRERLKFARMYLAITHEIRRRIFDNCKRGNISGVEMEAILVLVAVFIGDADGRPTNASKIAAYSGLPRSTVYRRLEQLVRLGKVDRVGRRYYLARDAVTSDSNGRLSRIFRDFCEN